MGGHVKGDWFKSRKSAFNRLASLALTAILLLSVFAAISGIASAASSQTWYLDSDSHPAGSGDISPERERCMWKNDASNCSGSVDPGVLSKTWVADEAVACNVTFPAGTWNGQLEWSTGLGVSLNVHYRIGVYNSTTKTFTTKGDNETLLEINIGSQTNRSFNITTTVPFTVNESEYLAFQFDSVTVDIGRYIITDGDSWIESPETDPGYPVPELSTLVLFSTGLLALAGFVLRKRK